MGRKKKSEVPRVDKTLNIAELKQALDNAEKQIRIVKQLLFSELYKEKISTLCVDENVIEGIFDGAGMMGADGKKYLIPSNYASKSKLVCGDVMKLTIKSDGTYIYKQIGPVERKRMNGMLNESEGQYFAECDGKILNILAASVTYFKAKEGDNITLLVAKDQESNWGALDNVNPVI